MRRLPLVRFFALSLSASALLATTPDLLPSPLEPAGTGGYAALDRALGKLSSHRRLLVIGAHPDDEDTSALAYVSRALDGEAAYLSLSRGEGGQNLIGPDLGEGLGTIRTQELLAARGVDGGRQYFTRAFDFGYTRSLPETLQKWPEAVLLEDAVRVVRRFQPQIVLSIFGDDTSGGHGQHQAAGYTAFRVAAKAADPAFRPELGTPWKIASLFRSGWFDPDNAKVVVNMGAIDPWSGLSVTQIAALSRSRHASQDMGRLLEIGPRDARYRFVEGSGADGSELFAGVDTSLPAIAAPLGATPFADKVRERLRTAEAEAKGARAQLRADRMGAAVEPLARILGELDAARQSAALSPSPAKNAVLALIDEKIAIAEQALTVAAGLAIDAFVDRETPVAGGEVELTWVVWNSGGAKVRLVALDAAGTAGATPAAADDFAVRLAAEADLTAGKAVRLARRLAVPRDAAPTRPYFLERPRLGDLYDWSGVAEPLRGEPFGPAPVIARFGLEVAGRRLTVEREAVYRYADQARGEIRRPVRVVPRLAVSLEPDLVVWPRGAVAPRVKVALASNLDRPLAGEITFAGDCAGRRGVGTPFRIDAPRGVAHVEVPAPDCAGAGRARLSVVATTADGERGVAGTPLAHVTHLPPTLLRGGDAFDLVPVDIRLPPLRRVGYVLGASDRVPELLAAIGVPIHLLSASELESGDLSAYDAIVVGSRAYETDEALRKANPRILAYARGGGLVVVQYQQYPFIDGGFAPYPLRIDRPHDRVTDEASPVRILAPEHPAFTRPNALTASDWDGWAQERALYMPAGWDAAYEPLIELQDPGQPARRGGLLVAPVGEGTWVYTGIAFFRQLPAGVPGAYRLFANLLGLGRDVPARAARLQAQGASLADRLLVADTHIDVPYRLKDEMENVSERTAKGDFDYPRAVAGGLDVTFMSIYVPASYQESGGAKALADELIDMVEGIAKAAPEKWAMAATADQAIANRAAGKLSFAMGIENGAALEDDLANVRHFFDRGVRYITLTHGKNNLIGDSSYELPDARKWNGLSPFGREVVAEMNRLGILVDLSHVSDATFDQALELSRAAPIVSHSSCRAFTPGFERNLDDDRIRALARKGGVLQINFGTSFLTAAGNAYALDGYKAEQAFLKEKGVAADSPEAKAFEASWREENPLPRATLDDVVAHIDHVVKLVGVDHVGIGSDYDGVGDSLPEGLKDVSTYPNLFARLLARGYSEADIEKIAGGNTLRIWREAERVARESAR